MGNTPGMVNSVRNAQQTQTFFLQDGWALSSFGTQRLENVFAFLG
jgi:hypothetical protein